MDAHQGNTLITFAPIYDAPYTNGVLLHVSVPGFPDDLFRVNIPEWIGTRFQRLIIWSAIRSQWSQLGDGSARLEWTEPGVCSLSVLLRPGSDTVDITITVGNLTDDVWDDVFAFNCLALLQAPTFADPEMARTYVCTGDSGFRRLADTSRDTNQVISGRQQMQFYMVRGNAPPAWLLRDGFNCISPETVSRAFVATVAAGCTKVVGMAAADGLFVFNNSGYSCVHVASRIASLQPGERRDMKCRIYFVAGTLRDVYERYSEEFGL
jgi:hypothetical protein